MEGVYPIIIDGELTGKLTVTPRGVLTDFNAECRKMPGIIRISVYGGDKEGYLGVLMPERDRLVLHRTLSRTAMREFPESVDSVERAGLLEQRLRAAEQAAHEGLAVYEEPPAPTEEAAEGEGEQPIAVMQAVPETLQAGENDDDLYWYSSPDGALVRFDGEQNLIALPLGDPRIPEGGGGELRLVEGREYQVFRTKNGRLIR